jgi:hypothetical protein
VRRNRADVTKLCEVINAYKELFSKGELELLARLAKNSDVVKAFERLTRSRCDYEYVYLSISRACVEAEQLTRTFPQQLREARQTILQMERLDEAVAELRRFVDEPPKQRHERFSAMSHGLDLIADRIEAKRWGAKDALAWIGATRKTQIKEAAELSAIWLLANQVHRATGRAYVAEVADLAGAILRSSVSLERVRHVMRSRRRRQFDEMIAAQTS